MQASSFYSRWFGPAVALCAILASSVLGVRSSAAETRSAESRGALSRISAENEQDGLVVTTGDVLDLKILEGGEEHRNEIQRSIRESIWEFNGKDRFFYSSCDEKPNVSPVKGGYQDDGERVVFMSESEGPSRSKVVGVLTVMDHKAVIVQHVEVVPPGAAEGAKPVIYEFIVSLRPGTGDNTRVVRAVRT
jgi:hypothetical protein